MKKRGQITIFLILGFVILAAFMLVYYLKSSAMGQLKINNYDISQLDSYISACLEETTEDAIEKIGKGAGFILDAKDDAAEGVQSVPLFIDKNVYVPAYYDGNDYYVVRTRIPRLNLYKNNLYDPIYRPKCSADNSCGYSTQNQMEQYIDSKMKECVEASDEIFSLQGAELKFIRLEGSTSAGINEDDVSVVYRPEIEVIKGNEVKNLGRYSYTSSKKLKKLFVLAEGGSVNYVIDISGIIESNSRDPDFEVSRDGIEILQDVLDYNPSEIKLYAGQFQNGNELVVVEDAKNDYRYRFLI